MEQTYQLKFSMGTQSEVIPKTPYKELENHRFLARINATLSLQQKFKKINAFIKIPEEYKDYRPGIIRYEDSIKYKWANHLPLPELNPKWSGNKYFKNDNGKNIQENEYHYFINGVAIVKNKKYKAGKVAPPIKEEIPNEKIAPPVEEKPRVRRQRPNRHVLLRQETELNSRLEELQKQEDDLTIQYKEAQSCCRVAKRELEEAELSLEEVNKKSLDIKTKQNEVKEEIKKNKIEIAKKNNKNGYVILAHDDYEGKEQVYGFSKTLEEAQTIAEEAVKMGSRRLEKRVAIETGFVERAKIEALWRSDNKWYCATIRKVTEGKFDVNWTDGGQYTNGLELHQIRNVTDYNKFNSARIVDLDTQIELEEYGSYNSNTYIEW
jgi:hypothetical protein